MNKFKWKDNAACLDYDTNVSSIFSSIFAYYATTFSTQSSISVVENQTQSSVSSLQQQIYDLSTTFTSSFSTVFYSSIFPIKLAYSVATIIPSATATP